MSSKALSDSLPYNPSDLPRELNRHYIAASDQDIADMLQTIGANSLDELYQHIPANSRFASHPDLPEELSYEALQSRLLKLAQQNTIRPSFIGDALPAYQVPDLVPFVSNIRNLTTAYTPYQPERSQGTLMTHWIYQCTMSQLTGFEAINSSLYDRSTAIFEAICTAIRLGRNTNTVLIPDGLFPGDIEVLKTLAAETEISLQPFPLDPLSGTIHLDTLREKITQLGDSLAAIVFPQVNALGLLEDVDALTRLAASANIRSIAVIDPMLLASGALKPPHDFGDQGVDMIVGEAQHLAIGPNFGGPGLGLFGVRRDGSHKNDIRQTPGRYVGKANDLDGRECLVMVLSTREQHIRKDKATSNICSNQAFLATLAGAAILARGEKGMAASAAQGRTQALAALSRISESTPLKLAFPRSPFFNELLLELPESPTLAIEAARQAGLHLGVDISDRIAGHRNLIKISFSDLPADLDALLRFLHAQYGKITASPTTAPEIPQALLRSQPVGLPNFTPSVLRDYYTQLGDLNVSPDDACYPLGSCTMKYNPFINDWAANLTGFTNIHPQAPSADAQGSLELLYEIQEWFKKITGLAGVTTQPVAGAQGELVGLKLFQAYHRDHSATPRDVILIPESAHGTNFATAAMAGYQTKRIDGLPVGIVLLKANANGTINIEDFDQKVALYRNRLAGMMVTNPNTCGLFETHFRELAAKIHEAGGLVYMDGANMNAIAGWVDLGALGVDAVHNNLHKTWTIPHGGGGPGDAIVAVSEKLLPYLPGHQIEKTIKGYLPVLPEKSIGSFHRHWGNFAHKIRAYAYLLRLGNAGVPRMTALATLSARYCFEQLRHTYPILPEGTEDTPRMHEFILTLAPEDFDALEAAGVPRALAISRVGKLCLDFGFHAPTVAWPETFGLMIEPTESYTKAELDRFNLAIVAIKKMVREHPEVLSVVPLFTPVDRIDDVAANRNLLLCEPLTNLPTIHPNRFAPSEIATLPIDDLYEKIVHSAQSLIKSKS